MLNCISTYFMCEGLSDYRGQKGCDIKNIPILNKFKCFITFNACNKYPMWNIKKDIHFNQMGPQKMFAS